ncbi:hypothetical protein V502_01283 [Pseudogymnoascus sp. VKM F-4520 (FW-2644)]|nr:hypothetical protein V502_01283 [Pseudogymnoascus sp. VKM F-4520 (FW-2644)]
MERLRFHALKILSTIHANLSPHDPSSRDTTPLSDELLDLPPLVLALLRRQTALLLKPVGSYNGALLLTRLEDLERTARGKLYVYPFHQVPVAWRRLVCDVGIVRAVAAIIGISGGDGGEVGWIDEVVKTLDMVLIMSGAPGEGRREWIEKTFEILEDVIAEGASPGEGSERVYMALDATQSARKEAPGIHPLEPPAKRARIGNATSPLGDKIYCFPSSPSFTPPVLHPIPRMELPNTYTFMSNPADTDVGPVPVVFTGGMGHWPAMSERPWSNPQYLLKRTLGGRRLVPVEVGRSYVDGGWGQRIIPLKEFLEEFVMRPSAVGQAEKGEAGDSAMDKEQDEKGKTGYLAQHNLFSQIPALRSDILIPDVCWLDPPPPHYSSPLADVHAATAKLDEPLLNAWFGPGGTISPLHVDPYHNILAQVVGRKYVRLYGPRETAGLSPRGEESGVDMGNTSLVDVGAWEGWDAVPVDEEGGEDGEMEVETEGREVKRERYMERFKAFGEASKRDEEGHVVAESPAIKTYVDGSKTAQKAKMQLQTRWRQKKLNFVLGGIKAPKSARNPSKQSEPFRQESYVWKKVTGGLIDAPYAALGLIQCNLR